MRRLRLSLALAAAFFAGTLSVIQIVWQAQTPAYPVPEKYLP